MYVITTWNLTSDTWQQEFGSFVFVKFLLQKKDTNELFTIESNVIFKTEETEATEQLYNNKGFEDVLLLNTAYFGEKRTNEKHSDTANGQLFLIEIPNNTEIQEINFK